MTTRIIGICLVRNEENFALWALGNALPFCDEVIVIDNFSSDATWSQLEAFAAAHPTVRLVRDANASGTNSYLQEYIGKDVWVFGIDGDEVYDRDGLVRFRQRILAGEFARHWRVQPHMVHATRVDLDGGMAQGYVTPHAAAPGKLYNFALIDSWTPDRQRLHGKPEIKAGSKDSRLSLATVERWEQADFRCLHLCFFPRSSLDAATEMRSNITDKYLRHAVRRPLFALLLRLPLGEAWRAYLARRAMPIKVRYYMRGPLTDVPLAGFGRPSAAAAAIVAELSAQRGTNPDLRSGLDQLYGKR